MVKLCGIVEDSYSSIIMSSAVTLVKLTSKAVARILMGEGALGMTLTSKNGIASQVGYSIIHNACFTLMLSPGHPSQYTISVLLSGHLPNATFECRFAGWLIMAHLNIYSNYRSGVTC